jgi:multiple sugar transport system substrate-binding protein
MSCRQGLLNLGGMEAISIRMVIMTVVNFDEPMFKEWMQFRYDLEQVDKSQVCYSDVTSMNMDYRDKFFKGEIAMLPKGNWMVPELDDQDKYPHDFVTTFAPMPAWKDAEPGTAYTESLFYSISKTSKHPQEAYDFIRFYTTEGMRIRGISVSAEKGIDKMEFMRMQVDNTKYVDVEALEKVMNNPDWKDLIYDNVPVYNKEMSQMMIEESAKFLLGKDSLDNVIASMMQKGTKVMKDKGTN